MQHMNPIHAAYNDFTEASRHIWEGQNRPLTTAECEEHAQATADKFGLNWRWDDEDGIVFSSKPH